MKEEFAALGIPYGDRISRLEESVEVYKRCWTHDWVAFEGRHFRFEGVRMDPKPLQHPRPPIYYGGVTRAAARIAARGCDGFYPTFVDPQATSDRYKPVLAELPELLAAEGRSQAEFALLAVLSARVDAGGGAEAGRGALGKGSPAKILMDLETLAAAGFSTVVLHLDTLDGSHDEWCRQLDLVGEHVLPEAARISHDGGWATG
jgi:alkanesulfonate monooxygenase SsuD/methylene tetrahydromethanopterin reductase-like flavin-dependent oxidoreductase (luciferase family)